MYMLFVHVDFPTRILVFKSGGNRKVNGFKGDKFTCNGFTLSVYSTLRIYTEGETVGIEFVTVNSFTILFPDNFNTNFFETEMSVFNYDEIMSDDDFVFYSKISYSEMK